MFLGITVAPHLLKTYRYLRIGLWSMVLLIGGALFIAMMFPDFQYTFSFRNPNSSRNNLLDPRLADNTPRLNGKISPSEVLLLNAGVSGDYSDVALTAKLENKSELTEQIEVRLRKSYRAFLLPHGQPIDDFPRENLYRVDDTYYALRGDTLFPFVSEKAYLSRYLESFAIPQTPEWLGPYPIADEFVGFRVGSLLSFADGVFIVTSESEVRPVGSAEIFLALGYRFQDVIPVSEEDLGIYERGRIIQLGFTHPSGTVFLDRDTASIYVIDGMTKRLVLSEEYREFLKKKQMPIEVSQAATEASVRCTLTPHLFARTLSCQTPLDQLSSLPGSDLEFAFSSPERLVDINSLKVTLETRKNSTNALRLLSQMKQRIFNRFGIGNE